MTTQEIMDQASYELLNQNNPQMIEKINAAFDEGITAQQIERQLLSRFGQTNLTAALVTCAAYYIEKQVSQCNPL